MNLETKIMILYILVLISGCGFNCKTYLENEVRPIVYIGKVINKEHSNISCFGNIEIMTNNDKVIMKNICYCVPEISNIWKVTNIGDSIVKKRNSLEVFIIKKDTTLKLEYPCCDQ